MSRIRKSLTIYIMLLLFLMTAGCGSKNDMEISAEDQSFLDELTEHEKEILGEGTLEMYPSLSEEMKEDEREKMEMSSRAWDYLEEKYPDVEFNYKSNLPNQYVYFTVQDGQEKLKIEVSVKHEGDDFVFTDNYIERKAEPVLEEEMREYFSQYFDEDSFAVDSEITKLEEGAESLLTTAEADTQLIIKKKAYDITYIMEALEDYKNYLEGNDCTQALNGGITLLDDDELQYRLDTAADYSWEITYIRSSRCSRNFAVVTGGDNAGLYLDGGEVVLKDGEIIPVYAEELMDEDENGQ